MLTQNLINDKDLKPLDVNLSCDDVIDTIRNQCAPHHSVVKMVGKNEFVRRCFFPLLFKTKSVSKSLKLKVKESKIMAMSHVHVS